MGVLIGVLGLLVTGAVPASAAGSDKITDSRSWRVELLRTGGFAGVHELYTAYRYDPRQNEDVFTLADSAEFKSLRGEYPPKSWCCDFFEYDLTVWYEDGTIKDIVTQDTAVAPDVLWKVIRLMTAVPAAASPRLAP